MSSGVARPGGSVTFYNCGSSSNSATKSAFASGTLSLNSSGSATYSTSALPVGTMYVEAVYSASGNYGGSTSNVVSQVVNPIGTSSVLTSAPNPSTFGQSVTFTDTVSSSSGTPGGTVSFYGCSFSGCTPGALLDTATLSGGKATFTTSVLGAGTDYVDAVYAASGNYGGSTSNIVAQVVNALATTTKLTSSPNPSTYGTAVTFTATVSATTGTPTGTVSFYSCTTSSCGTKTLLGTGTLSGGQATYATSTLTLGTDYVEAVYGASGNYSSSASAVLSQVVNAEATTTSLTSSPNPSTYGTSVSFTATVSASTGTPTGTVTFYSCTTSSCGTKSSLGTATLSSGKATYSTSTLPVGTDYVEAVYAASGNYAGSTSGVVSQKVNKASTSLVLSASPNPSHFGQAVSLSAQTTPGTGPTGTVTFYQDSPAQWLGEIETATLNASGQATLVTQSLPPGTYIDLRLLRGRCQPQLQPVEHLDRDGGLQLVVPKWHH